jgi:hypothetical protein
VNTEEIQVQRGESSLVKLDKAASLIEQAKSLDEAFALKAIFQVAEIEARRTKSIEVEKKATEYKIWTINKIGELLWTTKQNGGRANERGSNKMNPGVATLKHLKISRAMASRAQKFYLMPEEEKLSIINSAMRRIERREFLQKQKTASDIPSDWLVNKPLTIPERIESFHKHFPNAPRMMTNSEGVYDRIYGAWIIGKPSMLVGEYYGEYPPTLLERIESFFTDCTTIIHLFSGKIQANPPRVITYDINRKLKPTICDDIANLTKHAEYFRRPNLLVMCDPYYEDSDFARQGQKPINKKKVLDDYALIWSSEVWEEIGFIAIRIGSNTRYRGLQIFCKK